MHLPPKPQITADTTWSIPAISNVINALQVVSENTITRKNGINASAESIRLQINSAFDQQQQWLEERKHLVLHHFENMICSLEQETDNGQQEVEQMTVDLEGYLALLQSKDEKSGTNNEDKLHAWITSTLLQASDLCQTYSSQVGCIRFEHNDLKEIISKFGELRMNISEEDDITKGDESDGIAVVNDNQWLHNSRETDIEVERMDSKVSSSQSKSLTIDSDERDCWLVTTNHPNKSDEEIKPLDDSIISRWLCGNAATDWLTTQSLTKKEQDGYMPVTSSDSPGDLTKWLSPKSLQNNNASTESSKVNLLIDDMVAVSLSDNSRWLCQESSNSTNDDDMCQWLAGKSSNQCGSCKSSCPFDDFQNDSSIDAKKKWLSTATNW